MTDIFKLLLSLSPHVQRAIALLFINRFVPPTRKKRLNPRQPRQGRFIEVPTSQHYLNSSFELQSPGTLLMSGISFLMSHDVDLMPGKADVLYYNVAKVGEKCARIGHDAFARDVRFPGTESTRLNSFSPNPAGRARATARGRPRGKGHHGDCEPAAETAGLPQTS